MSRREKLLKQELVAEIRKSGGSFKKQDDYSRIMHRFAERLAALNIQISSVSQLKVRHIEMYMNSRSSDEVSRRTRQNEMSAIRVMLRNAGKHKMADPTHDRLNNKSLGISDTSRMGTKKSIPEERYLQIMDSIEKKNEGVAVAVCLSRYIGLRNEEAIQSAKSLKTWKAALLRGDKTLKVIFGTKGGRARMTTIVDREKVLEAVSHAIKYAENNNGKIIDKPDLKSAMDFYRNTLRTEMTGGNETPHSLRYSFAEDAFRYHLAQGYSKEESLALTSMDLGHGDGRGTYIRNVYCQSLMADY
ncbi:integrase domain-containing protein [Phytobacter diazotrophicus]|uniref:integrase domain-containing protein n=1 Tax=Enterobacteriaceae TaxID=543 RepID=UPI001C99CAD3|nr:MULTISPECIES: integrase domain-containing protein [Enterobacteriaceae]MBY6257801.1 integrase domain-containing protein [Phytobacter diazotrophicus]